MSFPKKKIIISLPADRCVKNFLDTKIYEQLKKDYIIHFFTPLSKIAEFKEAYGGDGIFFHDSPRLLNSWLNLRSKLYYVMEICRYHGYFFRFRKFLSVIWAGESRFDMDYDKKIYVPKPPFKYFLILALSLFETSFRIRRIFLYVFGNWVFRNPALTHFFSIEKPDIFISLPHWSIDENIMCFFANKYKLKTILVPISEDILYTSGALFQRFHKYAITGPVMRENAIFYHGIKDDCLMACGIFLNRLYEEMHASSNNSYDIKNIYKIPPGAKVITYFAVWEFGYPDLYAVIDFLLSKIESGEIPNAVLLLRLTPWDNRMDEVILRYGSRDKIRIQVPGKKVADQVGLFVFKYNFSNIEYLQTIVQSDLLVMSGTTSSIFQSCLFNIPVVINLTEFNRLPKGCSIRQREEQVNPDFYSEGIPTAYSLDQLLSIINENLNEPEKYHIVREKVIRRFDFCDKNYINHFLTTVHELAEGQ